MGEWTVQPSLNRLQRGERTEQLEPRVMQVLLCLAAAGGEVVTREEILETVWPDTIIGEEGLTRRVSQLRKVLGDDREHPRYIETIRKGGYRLVADIGPVAPAPSPTTVSVTAPDQRKRLLPVIAGLALVLALLLWLRHCGADADRAPAFDLLGARPLTSHPGRELMPAVSPDGTRVAYAWNPEDRGRYAVYVQQIGSENPLQLTNGPGHQLYPAWSADGSRIAYVQTARGLSTIRSVAALGGNHRLLHEPGGRILDLTWLDDGALVFSRPDTAAGTVRLSRLDPATGTVTPLTSPERRHGGDYSPRQQPGGERLAFVRDDGNGYRDIHLLEADGSVRRLSRQFAPMSGLAWWPDGRSLLVGSMLRGRFELWRIDAGTGAGRPLPAAGQGMLFPAVARDVPVIVFEEYRADTDVWRLDLSAPGVPAGAPRPLVVSTREDQAGALSPDGSEVAFLSDRSGVLELWLQDNTTRETVQLTRLGGADIRNPYWSPDGRTLAFGARHEGTQTVFLLDRDTGRLRRIGGQGHHDRLRGWTADGRRLLVASDRGGDWEIWALDAASGAAEMLTDRGSSLVGTRDGDRILFYRQTNCAAIHRLDTATGETTVAVPEREARRLLGLCIAPDGMYFTSAAGDSVRLQWWPGGDAGSVVLGSLPRRSGRDLSLSADGRTLLVDHVEGVSNDLFVSTP